MSPDSTINLILSSLSSTFFHLQHLFNSFSISRAVKICRGTQGCNNTVRTYQFFGASLLMRKEGCSADMRAICDVYNISYANQKGEPYLSSLFLFFDAG